MNFIVWFFTIILYQPMLSLLIWLYGLIGNFGIAIIILTLIIKILLHPLNKKAIESQKNMAELQPKINELQNKYKDNKEKQAAEMIKLYKEEKFNPFAGILLLFIQLPILIALYQVFQNGMDLVKIKEMLYPFINLPQVIYPYFISFQNGTNLIEILDLSKANIYLAALAGVAQYFQIKTATPPIPKQEGPIDTMGEVSSMMQKQMVYFVPLLTFFILFRLPSALGLYWIVTAIISIFEQKRLFKKK
ncbi:MAG: YidC/Oxa1 family membrane protein insertase [Candidatus Paceibacterota bacterium]|jgi:YidC/Oxa1 family membrane protein insertase